MERLVALGLMLSLCCVGIRGKHWGYQNTGETYGQKQWHNFYPNCGKKNQSPIVLDTKTCQKTSFKPLKFINLVEVLNNGHTAQVNIIQKRRVEMTGGPLKNMYYVEQFHFHWGSNKSVKKGLGTEHVMRDVPTSLELHIVTYNSKYRSINEAVSKPDGLSVFGVLFKVEKEDDESITIGDILPKGPMSKIVEPSSQTMAKAPIVHKLVEMLKKSKVTESYFQYHGSLTTPPCSETVLWMISKKTLSVSPCTLKRLQNLKDSNGNPMQDNFRFPQPLNGRVVKCN